MSNKNNTNASNSNNTQPSKEKEGASQTTTSPEVVDFEKIISALTSEYPITNWRESEAKAEHQIFSFKIAEPRSTSITG